MVKLFTEMHNVEERDNTRDWSQSSVKTLFFDVAQQPVPSYQNPWELAQLVEIFVRMQPKSYLELGPYHGGTLYWFIKNAAQGCKFAGVDFFDEKLGPRYAKPEDWVQWAKEMDNQFGVEWGLSYTHFEGNTHDPAIQAAVGAHFSDGGLDWLFIDATHDYEDCRQDLMDYSKFMNPNGVICLHDVRPRNMGSYQVWEELRQAGYKSQLLVANPDSDNVNAGIGVIYL